MPVIALSVEKGHIQASGEQASTPFPHSRNTHQEDGMRPAPPAAGDAHRVHARAVVVYDQVAARDAGQEAGPFAGAPHDSLRRRHRRHAEPRHPAQVALLADQVGAHMPVGATGHELQVGAAIFTASLAFRQSSDRISAMCVRHSAQGGDWQAGVPKRYAESLHFTALGAHNKQQAARDGGIRGAHHPLRHCHLAQEQGNGWFDGATHVPHAQGPHRVGGANKRSGCATKSKDGAHLVRRMCRPPAEQLRPHAAVCGLHQQAEEGHIAREVAHHQLMRPVAPPQACDRRAVLGAVDVTTPRLLRAGAVQEEHMNSSSTSARHQCAAVHEAQAACE